jgi:2'-5' RNA ligase
VTLHHLGDYIDLPPGRVDAALSALDRIVMSPFQITLDHLASFRGKPGSNPCVLRSPDDHPGLDAIWHESRVQFAAAGFAHWLQRTFTPHLTLLYGDNLLHAPIPIEPIAWTVGEVVLMHSLLGKTVHRVLGRRQLQRLGEQA